MGKRAQQAVETFLHGANCAQAVLSAFAADCSLDAETALKLAAPFGGGVARKREICGAVTAMCMVAGLRSGYSAFDDKAQKDAHYKRVQALIDAVDARFGAHDCKTLLALPAQTPVSAVSTPRTPEFYHARPCARYVRFCAELLEKEFFADEPAS